MKQLVIGALLAVVLVACEAKENERRELDVGELRPVDQLDYPFSEIRIIFAQPFEVGQPFENNWQKGDERYTQGTFVILETDPSYAARRNSLTPVLFAGEQAVQRLDSGPGTGPIIGIVAGDYLKERAPFWFSLPALPEQIGPEAARNGYETALKAGLRDSSAQLEGLRTRDIVSSPDLSTFLAREAAEAVLEFAPEHKRLAEIWRLPVVGEN